MNITHRLAISAPPMLSDASSMLHRGGATSPVLATPLAVVVGIGVAGFVGGYVAGARG